MENKGNEKAVYNNFVAVDTKTSKPKLITNTNNPTLRKKLIELHQLAKTFYKDSIFLLADDVTAHSQKVTIVTEKDETDDNKTLKNAYKTAKIYAKDTSLNNKYTGCISSDRIAELSGYRENPWRDPALSDINKIYEQLY